MEELAFKKHCVGSAPHQYYLPPVVSRLVLQAFDLHTLILGRYYEHYRGITRNSGSPEVEKQRAPKE